MRSIFTISQRERLGSFQLRRTKRGLELPRLSWVERLRSWVRDLLAKERKPPQFTDAPREPNWTQALIGAGFVLAVILWAMGAR